MQLSNKKVIIHDWDDTVTNSFHAYYDWYELFASYFNLARPAMPLVKKHWGAPLPTLVNSLWPDISHTEAEEHIVEFGKSREFLEADFTPHILEGVGEFLSSLKDKGFVLGILSSGRHESIQRTYERFLHPEYHSFHNFVITQHDTPYHKPDPKVFDTVIPHLEAENASFEETIYIGGSLLDFYAARDAGVDFLAVTTGVNIAEDFTHAGLLKEHIFDSILNITFL